MLDNPHRTSYIHGIGTATPAQDVHQPFVDWALTRLKTTCEQALFRRMERRSGIRHRWSVLRDAPVAPGGFYGGNRWPTTAARMAFYAEAAPELALQAIAALTERVPLGNVTHLIVASCTGFMAPGLDQIIAERLGLDDDLERTFVGFMGCYAAVPALRLAHHICRSEPTARVLVVTVELSSVHLANTTDLEALLAMLQFADGAAAALVTAEPAPVAISRFFSIPVPDSQGLIRWTIGDEGFEMHLSGEVPSRIAKWLGDPAKAGLILAERSAEESCWAVHPGGRSVLDAVEGAFDLPPEVLMPSRGVLERCGNMSSATLMFVLQDIMDRPTAEHGIALAFGPGIAAEGFGFELTQ